MLEFTPAARPSGEEMLSKKTVFVLNAVAVHLPPALFYCLPTYSVLDVGMAYAWTLLLWLLFVLCLFRTAPQQKWAGLWSLTSFFLVLVLLNPGAVTFLSWTIHGFSP